MRMSDWSSDVCSSGLEAITAAAQLRRDVDALGVLSSTMPTVSEETTSELAQALVGRLAQCRAVAGEGLPLLLDDAFCALDPSVKPLLLELLGRPAGRPQIVVLTGAGDRSAARRGGQGCGSTGSA